MALTTQEKERTRYHLGYPQVQPAASLQFGVPRPIQTAFLVESAMNLLLPEAEERVRLILKRLDDVETKMVEAQDRIAATQLEDLHLRDREPDLLEGEYARWAMRLADILGVPLYAYSQRFKGAAGGGSIPVR